MQRIIVFLGLVLVGGSLAVGTGWPGGHGPTIPRPDLAATSSPVPSSSPSASELPAHQRYLPTPTPSPLPSATPSATPSPSASPSASPSGMPNITPPPMPSMPPSPEPCGGCGGAGGVHKAGVACPMFCVENTN